jgi:hypothetical protein
MDCIHCHKNFKNIYSLTKHQKTAKYCLVLQGKIEEEINDDKIYMCGYCQKTLSTKYTLDAHINICLEGINAKRLQKEQKEQSDQLRIKEEKHKNELQERIFELEEKYKNELQERIFELEEKHALYIIKLEEKYEFRIKELNETIKHICIKAVEKPTKTSNTINNVNNNNVVFFNLSQEEIRDKCIQFGPERCKSIKDIANYTIENILTDDNGQLMYSCSDASRQIFKFIDSNGNTVKDPNATKLISQIRPIFDEKCASLKDRISYHREDKQRDLSKTKNINSKNYIIKELEDCKDYEDKLGRLQTNIKLMDKNQEFCKELIKRTC